LKVSTLISADFRVGSLKIAALTFVVITVSSKYSPVPDCFAFDAQPTQEIIRIVKRNIEKRLFNCVMVRSLWMIDETEASSIP
jgi:hypothetical protein